MMPEGIEMELEAARAAVEETRTKMEPHYAALGKVLYPVVRHDPPAEASDAMAALGELEQELDLRLDECDRIRGFVTCAACGKDVPYGSSFCNFCGVSIRKRGEPEPAPAAPQVQHCIYCGKEMDAGDKFCMFCGRAQ